MVVLVLDSDKFQQSVPQIQFLGDSWIFLLCSRDKYPQCIRSWCSSWLRLMCPSLCNDRCAVLCCRKLWSGSLQARDALHHGQYGPEGLFCWFFTMLLALCSLLCLQAQDARLLAVLDHKSVGVLQVQFLDKVFFMPVVVLRVVYWSRQCSIGGSAVAVHHGRRHSLLFCRGRSPWSWLFR